MYWYTMSLHVYVSMNIYRIKSKVMKQNVNNLSKTRFFSPAALMRI